MLDLGVDVTVSQWRGVPCTILAQLPYPSCIIGRVLVYFVVRFIHIHNAKPVTLTGSIAVEASPNQTRTPSSPTRYIGNCGSGSPPACRGGLPYLDERLYGRPDVGIPRDHGRHRWLACSRTPSATLIGSIPIATSPKGCRIRLSALFSPAASSSSGTCCRPSPPGPARSLVSSLRTGSVVS